MAGEAARLAKRERVTFHKLTREEHANSIRDLLGVNFNASDPSGLPEDPEWQGFERIGSVLSLSPAHMEKYLAADETILNEAMPAAWPSPQQVETFGQGAQDLEHARGIVTRFPSASSACLPRVGRSTTIRGRKCCGRRITG